MNVTNNLSPFLVPLTIIDHQQAQSFWARQHHPQKAKQVYLNTLAVRAVRVYLETLGIATELETSDSWDLLMQTLSDTADLNIKGIGKIECRPVLPDASTCAIPFESRENRCGYVAVQFDRELAQARLLGFTTTLEEEEETLPLTRFDSLVTLLDCLDEIATKIPTATLNGSSQKVVSSDNGTGAIIKLTQGRGENDSGAKLHSLKPDTSKKE